MSSGHDRVLAFPFVESREKYFQNFPKTVKFTVLLLLLFAGMRASIRPHENVI